MSEPNFSEQANNLQTIIVTGANAGIGFQASLHFARQGARVIMACRSLDKAETARQEILQEVPKADLRVIRLDVSDLVSVSEFAARFTEELGTLDILINNAGIVAMPLSRNSAGHEMQMATNYLGAFALTGLLLPCFRQDRQSRIVNVSSLAHRFGKTLEDLNWQNSEYDPWKSYAKSKIAMMNFTQELNRRLQKAGYNTIALGAHPGFANTNIHQSSPALNREKSNPVSKWFRGLMQRHVVPSAAEAARPIILAAEDPQVEGGDYYGPGGFLEIGGKPAKARLNKLARDTDKARVLWQESERLTGVSFLPLS